MTKLKNGILILERGEMEPSSTAFKSNNVLCFIFSIFYLILFIFLMALVPFTYKIMMALVPSPSGLDAP